MNQVTLIGNLTKDAKTFELQKDKVLSIITVAVNYSKKNNEKGVDFIPVKIVSSKKLAKYLTKGKKVSVVGKLQSYKKDDKTNLIVMATGIQFLSSRPASLEVNGDAVELGAEVEPF